MLRCELQNIANAICNFAVSFFLYDQSLKKLITFSRTNRLHTDVNYFPVVRNRPNLFCSPTTLQMKLTVRFSKEPQFFSLATLLFPSLFQQHEFIIMVISEDSNLKARLLIGCLEVNTFQRNGGIQDYYVISLQALNTLDESVNKKVACLQLNFKFIFYSVAISVIL